jgi:hypothetical protein
MVGETAGVGVSEGSGVSVAVKVCVIVRVEVSVGVMEGSRVGVSLAGKTVSVGRTVSETAAGAQAVRMEIKRDNPKNILKIFFTERIGMTFLLLSKVISCESWRHYREFSQDLQAV